MNTDPSKSRGGIAHDDLPRRQGLKLLLPGAALDTIRKEMSAGQHQNKETGGIIIGGRANINRLFVADLTGPGPNAHHHRTEFSPDIDHAQRCLDAYREDWDVYWLGVWHKHPGQKRTLSQGDVGQMQELVQDPDTLDEIVSIIATLQEDTIRLNGYHMDESLEPYRLPISIVDDDIPIRKQFLREYDPEPPQQSQTSVKVNSELGQKNDKKEINSRGNIQIGENEEGEDDNENFGNDAGGNPRENSQIDENEEGEDDNENFGNDADGNSIAIHRPTNSDAGMGPEAPSHNILDLAAATQSALLDAGLPAAGDKNHPEVKPSTYNPERDDIVTPINQKVPEESKQRGSSNQSEKEPPAESDENESTIFRRYIQMIHTVVRDYFRLYRC